MSDRPVSGSTNQVVMLGASNLFLGLPVALGHMIRRLPGRSLDIYVAHGPGRSYCTDEGVLGFRFRGISACDLFSVLEKNGDLHSGKIRVLITDVGNDIMYRIGSDPLLGWIEDIVDRLSHRDARIVITSLPIDSLERMAAWKFKILRPLFFPFRPATREFVLTELRKTQEGLERLGEKDGVHIIPTRSDWYGFDHFHLHRRGRAAAFGQWIDRLIEKRGEEPDRVVTISPWIRLRPPALYRFLGFRRGRPQPGRDLAPGVRLFVY